MPRTPRRTGTVAPRPEACIAATRGDDVKVTVDYDVCASTGTCVQECPEVFEIRPDGFLYLLMEEIPPELEKQAKNAEDLCPTGAITLVGADGKPLR
jgi:ferredoxin